MKIIFLQGGGFTRRSIRPFIPRSSVRRRAMFLVMDKAGLSGEDEQKCGKMFDCSSRIKRRVERRNDETNLLPRIRHTLSRTQWFVLFAQLSQHSQCSQFSHILISPYWEQSILIRHIRCDNLICLIFFQDLHGNYKNGLFLHIR